MPVSDKVRFKVRHR